jgi:Leucine-rich repeat (LRR) protein
VPEQVSALTALTRLDISGSRGLAGGWQHLLHLTRLRDLNLRALDLQAVPQQLSALTGLTRLNLLDNQQLAGDWQQLLLPLTQLCDLDLSFGSFAAVPEQVSALTALTCLNLTYNWSLDDGWQHLLSLSQLRHLKLPPDTTGPQQLTALTRLKLSCESLPLADS